jgi:hypothetical protein
MTNTTEFRARIRKFERNRIRPIGDVHGDLRFQRVAVGRIVEAKAIESEDAC